MPGSIPQYVIMSRLILEGLEGRAYGRSRREAEVSGNASQHRGDDTAPSQALVARGVVLRQASDDRLRSRLARGIGGTAAAGDRDHPRASRSRVRPGRWGYLPRLRDASGVEPAVGLSGRRETSPVQRTAAGDHGHGVRGVHARALDARASRWVPNRCRSGDDLLRAGCRLHSRAPIGVTGRRSVCGRRRDARPIARPPER